VSALANITIYIMLAATKVSTEAAAVQLASITSVKRYRRDNEQQEGLCRKAVRECKYPEEQMVKKFLKELVSFHSDSGKRNTPAVAPYSN